MKRLSSWLLILLLGMSIALSISDVAFAKRLGGGKSFGSRPSYSEPYRAPNGFNQARPAQQAIPQTPSPAAQHNQGLRDSMARRGGLMGMLGGLALGGLLGAMLFGGAFEHINLLDMLIFAGIAFLLFKLLAARRQSGQAPAASGYGHSREVYSDQRPSSVVNRAGFDTDILSSKGVAGGTAAAPIDMPADFDAKAFINGAKAAYAHLQQAWDNGELSELRALTTDKIFAELQDQIRARDGENRTELLSVDAQLLSVRDADSEREASVLFDVTMREHPAEEPVHVREVWHFVRPRASKQPTWFLDGIQQLAD